MASTIAQNVWDVYAQEDRPMAISELLDVYRNSKEYAEEYGTRQYILGGK